MKDEASYACDSCGKEIVVPIDLTEGANQESANSLIAASLTSPVPLK